MNSASARACLGLHARGEVSLPREQHALVLRRGRVAELLRRGAELLRPLGHVLRAEKVRLQRRHEADLQYNYRPVVPWLAQTWASTLSICTFVTPF